MTTEGPGGVLDHEAFAAARDSFLEALWEDYIITDQGRRLAAYISLGGEIDVRTREEIAKCLRGLNTTAHGNKDVARDVEFYTRVNWEMAASLLAMALNPTARGCAKPIKKQAFKLLGPEFGLSVRGAEVKYARGKDAFNDIFQTVDETAVDGNADAGSSAPSRSLHDLLTQYEVGKDPALLAEYVEHGGDISDVIMATVLRELRGEEAENRPHGNSNRYGDLQYHRDGILRRPSSLSMEDFDAKIASETRMSEERAKKKRLRGSRIKTGGLGTVDPD
jgi:hypothetical protein